MYAKFTLSSAPDALSWQTSGHKSNESQSANYGLFIVNGKVSFTEQSGQVISPDEVAEVMLNALLLE